MAAAGVRPVSDTGQSAGMSGRLSPPNTVVLMLR
jgi:hypothetical protein